MIRLTTLVFAITATVGVFALSVPARGAGADPYIVKRDRGGVVAEYHQVAKRLEAGSMRVIIDGVCASACTALLKNACATPKARIGFHHTALSRKARSRYKSKREIRLMKSMIVYLDGLLASHYPSRVRKWISRRGGLPSGNGILWLEGPEAQRVLGPCRIS